MSPSILSSRIGLQQDIGNAHEKVRTSSPQAQAYYDQGLAFLYSYDWIRAARSFNECLRLDPNVAMAYLGLSYSYSGLGDADLARQAENKAKDMVVSSSPAEQIRIDLRDEQLQAAAAEIGGRSSTVYIMALDNALINDSTNIILLLMRGMAAEGYATGIGQRGREDSIRYYTKVLDLDPSNMAAHHFLVHSYEMTSQVDKAIEQAAIYQKLAPAVAHAHHMYGHDLRRTEGLQQAIAQFEKAGQITEDFYRSEPETLLYDWNYRHNLSLLGAAYAQAGLLPDAARTLKKLEALPSMTPADDLYRANLMAFLLHEGNEDGAITAAAPLISSQFALGRLLGHVLSGSAAARLQDAKRASKELALAEKEATNLEPAWYGLVVTQMEILRAQVELLQGEREHPVSRLRTLVVRMCSMPGSDVWSDSVFHLRFIAEVAMKSGEWDLARFVAHQLETHAPYYAGTHSILALVAQHDGDNAGASRESNLARRLRQP